MADELHWKSAKLLPRFYDHIALSLIGTGPCRSIAKFKMGYGFIDDSVSPPTLLEVPDDLEDIPNVLYEGVPEMVHSDGRILAKCYMPNGSVTAPTQYSVTGLYDDLGALIAVTVDLPTWLVPSDRHVTYSYIDFPNVGENPPEAFDGGAA